MDCTKSYFKTYSMNKYFELDYIWGAATVLIGWSASFIMPVAHFITMVTALVLMDLYTGTRAALKRGEVIQSRGLRRTIEKITLYFTAILLAEGMKVVFVPFVPVTYITSLAIAMTEFKSNIENVESATGVEVWKYVKDKIKLK